MSQRYELKGKIGEGGIGTVHRAFDTQLKRDVAIKRLIPVDGGNSAAATENLIKEATTLSALQHPNIVTVYDVGTDEQGGFVVMELLKGETFDETINRGALTFDDFRNVVTQTLEALIAAHHTGLIHRDLKPSNLMVNWMPSGKFQIKILDFGLAKFSKQPSVQTIDQGDAILGSIYFMAPEQFERIPLDARTDLYSMGCMYYQSLTGKYPFDGDTAPMVMASHLQNRVQPLANLRPDLPLWLCDWVMWLISRKMDDRPESAKFAYERFQAEKGSPAGEAAAAAAAAVAEAQQRAVAANFRPPVPAHPPAGYGTQPVGAGAAAMRVPPKPSFPKWAMVTIPLLLALAVGIAVSKFGGRNERKKREALMVRLHEQVDNEEVPPGNRSTVDVVIDYMLEHSDNTNTVNSAIRILGALEGEGVDAAIADSLPKIKSSRQLQGTLLTIGQRGYEAGTSALMEYATHKDADVQRAALAAITQLGGREQLPKLVELAVKSVEAGNGNPFSDYIVQIASGIPNPDLRTEEIRKATKQLDGKPLGEILKMLGYLGGDAALMTIKQTLAGDDKDAKIGALLSLARWPDSSPNDILFRAATDSEDSQLQFVGVAAYVQNVARPSSLSAEKKLDQLKEVYAEIERPKDKRALLYGLGSIIDPAARELAESLAQEDPTIAKYANDAAARIEAGLQNLVTVTSDATLSAEHALLDAFTAKYDGSPDMLAITDWSNQQDRIYWPVRFKQPGTYSIQITQACKEGDQDEYEVTIANSKLEAKVVATGGETTFKTIDIGEIEIDNPGGYTLGVAPKQIRGKLLMNLRKIKIEKR